MTISPAPRFPLGEIVATPAALGALDKEGKAPSELLSRHATGDWGDVCSADCQANEHAVHEGTRILSVYELSSVVAIWIITEADRSSTCLLLPEAY
ncbi:MAG TPA: hypothetical protein EYQ75_22370 [Planctomycetaceae bacterium]|nr:hypothetical protein [Planctomycetaceae bacterium]